MNIHHLFLLLGVVAVAFGVSALPASASTHYIPNYGAGFATPPAYYGSTAQKPAYGANYGAGFAAPTYGSGAPIQGYGAGFNPAPAYFPSIGPAPVYTANYGTGFIGSPNLIYTPVNFRYGHYGAGYMPSPFPWFGFGW